MKYAGKTDGGEGKKGIRAVQPFPFGRSLKTWGMPILNENQVVFDNHS